jgi:hypothetical protein
MRRFAWLFMTIALISANGIVAHGQQPVWSKNSKASLLQHLWTRHCLLLALISLW